MLLHAFHYEQEHTKRRCDASKFQLHQDQDAEPNGINAKVQDDRHENRDRDQHDRDRVNKAAQQQHNTLHSDHQQDRGDDKRANPCNQ